MTQNEIIEMARQSGKHQWPLEPEFLTRFAKLVAQHTLANIDPSKFISFQEGVETGRLAEREALCKAMEDQIGWDMYDPAATAIQVIRARGDHDTR